MTPTELRTLRTRLNLSQAALAQLLGYKSGAQHIWRKESGRQAITQRDVIMLRTLADIADGESKPPK